MAYRLIGLSARLCLEMGLHKRESMMKFFPQEHQMYDAANTFWSIYILDRRWGIGVGFPFVIQDDDIDADLPKPVSVLSLLPSRPHTF